MAKIMAVIMVLILLSIPLAMFQANIPEGQHFAVDWGEYFNGIMGVAKDFATLNFFPLAPDPKPEPLPEDAGWWESVTVSIKNWLKSYIIPTEDGEVVDQTLFGFSRLDIAQYVYYTDFHAEPYPLPGT